MDLWKSNLVPHYSILQQQQQQQQYYNNTTTTTIFADCGNKSRVTVE
jgi:hypothetical protein